MHTYLSLLRQVLESGEPRTDRTGTGTLSVFGTQSRYDLRDGFPLVTTKKVLFDSVKKELLWFLRGETNTATLGSGIWDAWATPEGELGPIYGRQWRFWGAGTAQARGQPRFGAGGPSGAFASEGEAGIDQIQQAIELIRRDPTSRRILVSAWNVSELSQMALMPCHTLFQFYVAGRRLDLQLYQRSADLAVGVPFNIASYALLLMLVAAATDLTPGVFVHTIGDAHIYLNHVEGVKTQLARTPHPLPRVHLAKPPDFRPDGRPGIDLEPDDIRLEGYSHEPFIKFPVAV